MKKWGGGGLWRRGGRGEEKREEGERGKVEERKKDTRRGGGFKVGHERGDRGNEVGREGGGGWKMWSSRARKR